MAESEYPLEYFRPHRDVIGDLETLKDWCKWNGHSIGSVLSSFMPAICYAVTQQTFQVEDTDEKTGEILFDKDGNPKMKRYVRADFGDILLRERYYTQSHRE